MKTANDKKRSIKRFLISANHVVTDDTSKIDKKSSICFLNINIDAIGSKVNAMTEILKSLEQVIYVANI